MDFFNKIGSKVSEVTNSAVSKAKDFADTSSINRQISAEETKMNNIFADIGKIYYSKNKDNPTEEYAAAFSEIVSTKEKIEECKAQLQELKKTKTCANCGCQMAKESVFCAKCGAKSSEIPVVNSSSELVCANCGKAIPTGVAFCGNCGEKAPETVVEPAPSTIVCPGCGKENDNSVAFCASCGCKLK